MAKFKENSNMFSIVDETKAPIIHGHTRIDFKDVKTGKRERIESENTFMATTLGKYMRSLGTNVNSPYLNQTWRTQNMIRNFCGGVFLFKDAIPDGAEYMQAGNKMTANGAYDVVNNGTPVEFGSWNSVESNIDGNSSAVLVWDWTTSQGNGQISSVCLTSEIGGYIGYGNPSDVAHTTTKTLWDNQDTSITVGRGKIIYNNCRYAFDYTSPTLTVTRYRNAVTQASIFDKKVKSTTTFDLSQVGFSTTPSSLYSYPIDNDKVMIMPQTYINNNSAYEFVIYDPATDSLTFKSIVNTTGVTIRPEVSYYFENENLLFIYTPDLSPYHIYVCNGTTGAIIKSFEIERLSGGCVNRFGANLYSIDGYSRYIDMVNETMYKSNATSQRFRQGFTNTQNDFLFGADVDARILTPQESWGLRVFKNPLYLATINNLQDSVTKQNTQTMKVTYTLTEV